MNLIEFLEARITEDEEQANECLLPENLRPYSDPRIPPIQPEQWGDLADNYLGGDMGRFCQRFTPLRVLAECAAKRAIIESYTNLAAEAEKEHADPSEDVAIHSMAAATRMVLIALTFVYNSHPDYRKEWAA